MKVHPARAGQVPRWLVWNLHGAVHPRARGAGSPFSLSWLRIRVHPRARGRFDHPTAKLILHGFIPARGAGEIIPYSEQFAYGFIPARAGQVTLCSARTIYHEDHPRARGISSVSQS